ncbi:MAG: type 1 glutamine amidotransferase [Thermomicrobiales bacterium]
MTVLYVDTEHDLVLDHAELGPVHHARIEEVRDRLAGAAGQPCLVQRFTEIEPVQIGRAAPTAMVIGGSFTDWSAYDDTTLAGLLETIRAAPVPILGICAGHQLIGRAHGAAWGPLGALQPEEVDPEPGFAPGLRKERGFLPVAIDPHSPLFRGLATPATFFQHHYWQLEGVPAGFVARASSRWSPIQAIERLDRPVFGVQFHAERYDRAHPHGAAVLRNFFAIAETFAARGEAVVSVR